MKQALAGGDKRRSGVVSDKSTTAGLSGKEQRGLVGGRGMMDERMMVALSDIMVTLTAVRPGKLDALVQL